MVSNLQKKNEKINDLGEELADVLFVLICLANQTGVDLEKSFDLKFAVPGMEKDDLSIEIDNGFLTVSGERKIEDVNKNFHSIETGYGKFSRSFQLPDDINEEKISANCKNGILNISVMKDPKALLKKTIKIK